MKKHRREFIVIVVVLLLLTGYSPIRINVSSPSFEADLLPVSSGGSDANARAKLLDEARSLSRYELLDRAVILTERISGNDLLPLYKQFTLKANIGLRNPGSFRFKIELPGYTKSYGDDTVALETCVVQCKVVGISSPEGVHEMAREQALETFASALCKKPQ